MKRMLLLVLLISAAAYGQFHSHIWQKQNETRGQDAYGNTVVICSWKCSYDYNNHHFTQTQGMGYCPMPSP